MTKIAIIDYGAGNIASLKNAFSAIKIDAMVTSQIEEIKEAEKLVLPGVGAFAPAIQKLREKNLDKIIIDRARQSVPILGICLGMQLLFSVSYEGGKWPGLDLVPGVVLRFKNVSKIPHMGWNQIETQKSALFEKVGRNAYFYC